MMEKVTFRYAERKDVPLILEFIRGLAEHEGMPGDRHRGAFGGMAV